MATLAAVYTEQGRRDESREIAIRLCGLKNLTPEEVYKVATVCCENNLHERALEKFKELEKDIPYDGNMLYFKSVAAYNSGKIEMALDALETLCTIYPDAAVAEYYLKAIRRLSGASRSSRNPSSLIFTVSRRRRGRPLPRAVADRKIPAGGCGAVRLLALREGYFRWCLMKWTAWSATCNISRR
ncbi:MAG: tetratricopeptide repeat protein [Christensenellaceae bacterium]